MLASRRQLLQRCSSATLSGIHFPSAPADKPSEHENLFVVVIMTQFAQSDSLVQLPCREFHCSEFFSTHFWLFQSIHKNHFHLGTPKDLAVAKHFKDRCA